MPGSSFTATVLKMVLCGPTRLFKQVIGLSNIVSGFKSKLPFFSISVCKSCLKNAQPNVTLVTSRL